MYSDRATLNKNSMDKNLIEKAEKYVKEIFRDKYDNKSTYHSIEHVADVAEAAEKIGKASDLNEEELEAVIIAAWFHDVGYLFQQEDHESASVKVADEYLKGMEYPDRKIKSVIDCIVATKMNNVPANKMEEVIHDADSVHLSKQDYWKQSELLRREFVNYGAAESGEEEWLTAELKFLLKHRYHTEYAKGKWEEKKSENIKKLKKRLKQNRENEALILTIAEPEKVEISKAEQERLKLEEEEKKAVEKKEALITKGFESMYRLSATNHMRMNAIADKKANIMLTLNGIIISIAMSIVASDLDSHRRLMIPTSILIIVCLIAIIFATLSTRPKITAGVISKEDIEDKKSNLLFFGNFTRMSLKDFGVGIRQMMGDQDYLHNAMIQDFYDLGKVLEMKFRYLRICYNVFMYGIVTAVISLGVLIGLGY